MCLIFTCPSSDVVYHPSHSGPCFVSYTCSTFVCLFPPCLVCVLKPQWHPLPPPSCRLLLSSLSLASWLEFRRPVSGFELHCCADPFKLSNSAAFFFFLLHRDQSCSSVCQKRTKIYIHVCFICWHQEHPCCWCIDLSFMVLLSACVSVCILEAYDYTHNKCRFVVLLLELLLYLLHG